ncbi:coenzyme F420-0:L-glutamate ligase [Fodinibacter luteus]|uniref:Coenzyme F420-0:L-glutamate ligase n=2 Tax=Fodinibacter luteus TaxID=552064 RepID=A0ABP8KL83_9MICO
MPAHRLPGTLTVVPVTGVGEVVPGDDLASVLLDALAGAEVAVEPGDCLVVSSKVVSKALGLTWTGSREDAVAAGTVRVVAERAGEGHVTRVVEAVAGPVMAAAGVDASNTGPTDALLVLPDDPDAEAARLRGAVLDRLGLEASAPLAVVLSDTAGRPWRAGLADLALGSAGLRVLDDLRGAHDHDGRLLAVTVRAVADEVAAAADLVKGKADGIPAALVRGLDAGWFADEAPGARSLVRTGPGDWFALGDVEAVRAALGVEPGSAASTEVGVVPARPEEDLGPRVGRVVALALHDVPEGSADVGVDEASGRAEVTLAASDDYELGRLVTRCEVAAHSERLRARVTARGVRSVTVALSRG